MKSLFITITAVLLATAAFGAMSAEGLAKAEDLLPSWSDTAPKQAIIQFVEKVTREGGPDFVPPAERIATFDNDGTLWVEQPMYIQLAFALDRVKALAPNHPEWKTTQPFKAAIEDDIKGLAAAGMKGLVQLLMATHAGMTSEEFEQIVKNWLATAKHPRTGRLYTEMIYQPMLELLGYLRANGFKTYIASAGGIEFMRAVAEQIYGIPPEQVIGSSIKMKFEVRDGKPALIRLPELDFIDEKDGKPVGIHKFIGRRPLAAFGNSDGDFQMLEWTTSGSGPRLGLYVHHDDAAREFAYDRTSSIGRLDRGLEEAPARGWVVVSMQRDWRRVFAFTESGGGAPSDSSALTGIRWRVVELSGIPVATPLHGERPFILFDAAKRQATGYAGCNQFFGGYSLEGDALTFGPTGATKRACPDLETGLETEFFKALDATRRWEIVGGSLRLLSGDAVLARMEKAQGPERENAMTIQR